jgi:hypothetical protein
MALGLADLRLKEWLMLYEREIGKLALAVQRQGFGRSLLAAAKPNSKWAGAGGQNVPQLGGTPVLTPDEVLQKCIDLERQWR